MSENDLIIEPAWTSLGPHFDINQEMFTPEPCQYHRALCSPEQYPAYICDFFKGWQQAFEADLRPGNSRHSSGHLPPIGIVDDICFTPRPKRILSVDIAGPNQEIQGIDWVALGAFRQHARLLRKHQAILRGQGYTSTSTMAPVPSHLPKEPLLDFQFRRLTATHVPMYAHWQLRSVLACPSQAAYFYATDSKVFSTAPWLSKADIIFDVSTASQTYAPWRTNNTCSAISTLAADAEFIFVGGLSGDYAFQRLAASMDEPFQLGAYLPRGKDHAHQFINHASMFHDRHNGSPRICIASDSDRLGILDCSRNQIIAEHKLPWAPNATAICPNSQMRLVVGDDRNPVILEVDTGRLIQSLPPHARSGCACAWAPEGIYFATGHDDKRVQLFDARKWDKPVLVFKTEMDSASGLHFNPEGTGRKILLVAEASDMVHLVGYDGPHAGRVQTIDFFGQVSGCGFVGTGDGEFVVGNADWRFGGLMEFERIGGLESGKLDGEKTEKERKGDHRAFLMRSEIADLRF